MFDYEFNYKNFLEGDIDAFERIVLEYKDNLIYFISRYTGGDISTAEDIAQDVFAHLYVYKDQYNFSYSLKTYIFTLGKNKAIDYMRKQSRIIFNSYDNQLETQSEEKTLEDIIITKEEHRGLLAGFKSLSPDYQRALYLYVFEELSYKEIAKVMGKTLPQIKILIFRARKALKLELGEEDREDEK